MLYSGGYNIEARRVDAAVPQDIGQFGNVLFYAIKYSGKKMPQVVGENLFRVYPGFPAQGLHLPPDVRSTDSPARARHKYHTASDSLLRRIAEQFLFQLLHDENRAGLALAAHRGLAAPGRLHRNVLQFADPNTRAADSLQNQA